MSQRSRADGGRDGAARRWGPGRLALAAVLLALVAVGLRGTVPAATLDGSYRHDGLPLAAAAEVVLAGLLVALLARNARAPRDAVIAARLRRILTYVVGIGLVALPVAYVFDISAHVHLPARPGQHATSGGQPRLHPNPHSATPPIAFIILLVLAAAAAIYLVVRFLAAHRGTWTGWRRRAASVAIDPSGGDEGQLREAVESGRSALRLLDDARAAIIACYAAMEQTLAGAGTARETADTPDELLARAAGQGLIRTTAAARLAALFYEARFSSHPMPPARRDDAQRALAEVAASLAEPEPVAGAGSGPTTGPAGAGR
jgi:Domain of unknown function (DUF4129)